MLIKILCSNDLNSVGVINDFLTNDYNNYLDLNPVEFMFEEN